LQPLSIDLGWGLIVGTLTMLILAVAMIANMLLSGRQIRQSEKKFKLLFNKVFDCLIVVDSDGNIFDVNESACKLLGYRRKKLLDLPLEKLVGTKAWPRLKAELKKTIVSGIDYIGEIKLLDNKGKPIDAEIGGVTIQIEGGTFILGSFRDITRRRQTEETLISKNAALNEIMTHLEEEKVKIKKEVANTIDKIILPSLNKLINSDGTLNAQYHAHLKNNIQELANSTGGILHAYSKLSPREMEICNLIRNGSSSKEIANNLHISLVTVNKHRERIRRKLGISNKNINLTSYLKNL